MTAPKPTPTPPGAPKGQNTGATSIAPLDQPDPQYTDTSEHSFVSSQSLPPTPLGSIRKVDPHSPGAQPRDNRITDAAGNVVGTVPDERDNAGGNFDPAMKLDTSTTGFSHYEAGHAIGRAVAQVHITQVLNQVLNEIASWFD